MSALPSIKLLRECFDYNPSTGDLRWKKRPLKHFSSMRDRDWWNKRFAGTVAGCIHHSGYRVIYFERRMYLSHRIIWKLFTGNEPPKTIDHIDGDCINNSWCNLRAATMSEQMWNAPIMRNNTSGYRGVNFNQGKWWARIKVGDERRSLGRFDTPEEAAAAYEAAARKAHGAFFREEIV